MLSNILGIEEGGCSLQATVTRTGEPLGKLCVSQGAGEPPQALGTAARRAPKARCRERQATTEDSQAGGELVW